MTQTDVAFSTGRRASLPDPSLTGVSILLSLLIILHTILTIIAMPRFPPRHGTGACGITSTSTIRVRVVFGESEIFFHWEPGKMSTAVVRRMSKASSVLSFGRYQVVLHSLASSELRSMRQGLPTWADFSALRACNLSSSMTVVNALITVYVSR